MNKPNPYNLLPTNFKMKKGGTIQLLAEYDYDPPDPTVGQKETISITNVWKNNGKKYKNMNWILKHTLNYFIDMPSLNLT